MSNSDSVARATTPRPRGAGTVRQLPSGRWQARHRGTDGTLHPAPTTFITKLDAAAWLKTQSDDVRAGVWQPPQRTTTPTLRDYANQWLTERDIKMRTRTHYRTLLDRFILPDLGEVRLDRLAPATVRTWHAQLPDDTPTLRAHAYSLLRSIMRTAVADDLVTSNPCRMPKAGRATKAKTTVIPTPAEVAALVDALPARYQAQALVAAWCGLRFGEQIELRRDDIDLDGDDPVIHVRRAAVRVSGATHVTTPKSAAGVRTVAVPKVIVPALAAHLLRYAEPGRNGLVFPARQGGHMAPSALHKVFYKARKSIGREDLSWHDLRHFYGTAHQQSGATLRETQAAMGHSTVAAAMVYQHAAQSRQRQVADTMSSLAGGG